MGPALVKLEIANMVIVANGTVYTIYRFVLFIMMISLAIFVGGPTLNRINGNTHDKCQCNKRLNL